MSIWNDLKQLFFDKPLRVQFEQLLLEDEARKQKEELTPQIVDVAENIKEELVAKKKTTAKPAAKPANKNTKPAAKPAAKGKKK